MHQTVMNNRVDGDFGPSRAKKWELSEGKKCY